MDVFDFARRYLYPYKQKGEEIEAKYCPFCHGGKNKDESTFALNTVKLTYVCLRGSCGKSGTFKQLCAEFGEKAEGNYEIFKPQKTFKKPQTVLKPVTSAAEKYLALRKISKKTVDLLKISCDDGGNIIFPFYLNGSLEFVKFRPTKKIQKGERKSWRESGTQPILFGMDLCTPDKPLIITEGEIDCLSCYEAGLENIVSVPSGCEDLTWINNCWEWLEQFNKIILFGDNDTPGREMTKNLIVKLGEHRCYTVESHRKDANEVLYYDGCEAVKDVISQAKAVPLDGLLDISTVEQTDSRKRESIRSGIGSLDSLTGGFPVGQLSVWTGRRGEGKSTFLGQLLIESADQGKAVCAYSGELPAGDFKSWIYLQTAGKDYIKTQDNRGIPTDYFLENDVTAKIDEWFKGRFFICDNDILHDSKGNTSIITLFTYAVKRCDCKIFLVDNIMTAKYGMSNNSDYFRAQSNFVADLKAFAKKYKVHVHLVCHPRKTNEELDNDDVSGISDITNLADNVFSLTQATEKEKANGCTVDVTLKILKCRLYGKSKGTKIGLNFCPVSRRMFSPGIGDKKVYKWREPYWWEQAALDISEDCPW